MLIQQVGQTIRFSAFYTSSGLAKTGLLPGSVLTVDVLKPDGTTQASAASPVEDGSGWYHYDVSGTYTTSSYKGTWVATFKSTDSSCDQRHIGDRVYVGANWVENLDQAVSTRSTLSASSVWTYGTRNLTDFGLSITTPVTTPTVNVTGGGSTGGSLQAGAYYLKYTFVNTSGETQASPESLSFTVSAGNIPRATIPSLPSGSTSANIYLTATDGASGSETLYKTGIVSITTDLTTAFSSGNQPPPTVNTTNDLVNDIWTVATRTLTSFNFNVTVGSNTDKTGYSLASTGLDAISISDPGVVSAHTTLPKLIVAVYRYFYRKTTATASQLKTYKDDNTSINVTMALSNDGTTQTKATAT